MDDIQLTTILNCFLGARQLAKHPGFANQTQALLESYGLTEDPYLLIELEQIIDEITLDRLERERREAKAKQLARKRR